MAKIQPITCIYKITSPSGKVYVGQSYNVMVRFGQYKLIHKSKSQPVLYNSFSKYGIAAHLFEVVHELPNDVDVEVLASYEQLYMDQYRAAGIALLNIREAGSKGRLHPDTKAKIGAANKIALLGKKPPTTGKTLQEYFGEAKANELKKRISDKLKGRKVSAESLKKRAEYSAIHGGPRKGKIVSEETRLKQSLAKIGKPSGRKGLKQSDEAKRKMSESKRRLFADRKK